MFVSFCFPRAWQKLSFLFGAGSGHLPAEVYFLKYNVTAAHQKRDMQT